MVCLVDRVFEIWKILPYLLWGGFGLIVSCIGTNIRNIKCPHCCMIWLNYVWIPNYCIYLLLDEFELCFLSKKTSKPKPKLSFHINLRNFFCSSNLTFIAMRLFLLFIGIIVFVLVFLFCWCFRVYCLGDLFAGCGQCIMGSVPWVGLEREREEKAGKRRCSRPGKENETPKRSRKAKRHREAEQFGGQQGRRKALLLY